MNVGLLNNNKVQQDIIKSSILKSRLSINSLNLDIIEFHQTKGATTFSDINAGGIVYRKPEDIERACSMGMRVNYNGNKGYLTAGHCTLGYLAFPSGSVMATHFENMGKYDYGFIKVNNSYNPTNKLAYTTTGITKLGLVNYCPMIVSNMVVAKVGRNSKYTSGKVTEINATTIYTDSGYYIQGLVKTDYDSRKGDSGGVVMIPRTDANGGAIGIGIISGGFENYNVSFFTALIDLPTALQNRY